MSTRLARYNIVLNGDDLDDEELVTNYEDVVESILDKINRRVTGQAIFVKIKAHGSVLIEPYTKKDAAKTGTCNAYMTSTPFGFLALVKFSL